MEVAAALRGACGESNVRAGGELDTVGRCVPSFVAAPESVAGASAVLRAAASAGMRVAFRGAGTTLRWGNSPEGCDLLVDTTRMNALLEHDAGDLILRVQAGIPLASVQAVVGQHGQQLALDELYPGSTVGGALALGLSGPRRLLYGAARDLLTGITVIRADGTVAKSGGRVVKNVAGYDLGRLFTGSYGTLGLIAEAAFRLHPLPETSLWLQGQYPTLEAATAAARRVTTSQMAATAVELEADVPGPAILSVLLEGSLAGVESRAATLLPLLGEHAARLDAAPRDWNRLPVVDDEGALFRVAMTPGRLPQFAADFEALVYSAGLRLLLRGSGGAGVLHLGLPGSTPADELGPFIEALRDLVAPFDGTAVLLDAGSSADGIDRWGRVRGLDLMRAVKRQFDPGRVLAPGRFVGGI